MQTEVVPLSEAVLGSPALARVIALRRMTDEEFIERHASGTLRKNRRLGFAWKSQYLEERTAFEFGWSFQCLPKSRVTFGDAITESDSRPITEAGWVMDRFLARHPFPEDRFQVKYIKVDKADTTVQEGIGLIVFETSAPFVPAGNVVFAIVAEYDPVARDFRARLNAIH